KFHLLTSETTCHGSQLSDDGKAVVGPYIKENVTTYKLTAGRRFDEQPNYCQLPHGVVTRWYLKNNATRNRSERVETVYDDYGNITKHTSNDGVVETSTWYKQAEEGYPGNAERFVRHLKSKTITPASGHSGTALALTTHYRYQRLPVLASSVSDSSQEHWLALERETLESESDDPLKTVCYSYHAIAQEVPALDRPMHHGRLQSRTLQFPNPQANKNNGVPCTLDTKTTHRYSYLTQDWTTLRASGLSAMSAVPTLKVEQETEGFDGTSETTAQGFSRLTGEPVLDIDQDQVERMTAYDSLRRVILEVVAPATDSEAVRSTAHYLCATEGDQARQCLTDPQQVVTQTVYDGLGRVRTQSRNHVHPEQLDRLFPIHERSHDAWGREVSETESDWLDGLAFPDAGQSRTQAYRYDAWGERAIVIRHDGVQEHLSFDPTEKDAHNHVHKTRWLQAGGQTLKSEKVSTWSNAFDKPVRIERLDLSDKIVASQAFSYDGLGRCTSSTDERLNVTKFEYDAFGRMTVNLLPDDTRIEYEYAAHAEEEWRTCIKACPVNEAEAPWTVGTQTFDGLGRLASRKTGERLEQYMYQPGQSMPQSRLTGAGDAIQYDYNLALTTLPIKSTAHDDQAVFEYDPVTALPLKVGNDHGNRLFDYNRHEQLTEEHWVTHEGKLQTTHYTRSILGRLKTRRDAGGMSAEHTYDARGRLESLTEGNLHASLVYDSLGRLCQVTSTDQANGSTLQTDVEHDEHGREHKRLQLLDGGTCRTLVQHWGKDGLLDQRTLQVGDKTQREELFSYDRRGRLTKVEYSGTHLPVDDADRQMTRQIFRFDFLDNITHCLTSFIDGSTETAHYEHDPQERCQLSKLTLSRAGEEQRVLSFSHDANGNLMIDEQGRALQYDQQNRLLEITGNSRYRYDGAGQLLTSAVGTEPERMLWFEGDRLKLAVQGAIQTRYTFLDDMPLAQQSDDPAATLLLLTDASHSVIAESQAGILREATYTAHGQRHASPPLNSHLGFTGEALEPDSDWYLLGRGYRAYSPVLRRFNSPDSESPFDAGGLNPYAYCLGNPVTLRDPTGHQAQGGSGRPRRPDEDDPHWRGRTNADSGAMQWVWLGVAVVATIASVVTAGASLAAVGAFGAGAMAAVNAAGAAVAAGQGVGITTAFLSTFAGTGAVAAAVSTTTAVLAVAGTTAQAVATIGNDATAGKVAEYLGLGAAAIGGLTFGFGIVRSVVNAVRQGAEQVSRTGVVSAVGASAAVPVERTASAARQHSQSRGQQVMEGTSSAQPDLVKNRFRTNVPKLRTLGQISRTQYRFRMGR
uniref:RHS repeat-associated core domain-containing protein n=1 Tax=Pseudomonas alabamensis TaxID=3064349 RepID=UPI0011A5C249